MAVLVGAVYSQRVVGQDILRWSVNDVDGDQLNELVPPVGYGPFLILEMMVTVTSLATIATLATSSGPECFVGSRTQGTVADLIGIERWTLARTAAVAARVFPDQPALCKENESLFINFAEIDINVAPTGDCTYYVRARKISEAL